MFWSKLAKSIPFLFQAIVVIAAVLVFSYFDPFDIMASTRLKLKDTPVDVRSIRDIGQLITAEYYGEVVRSRTYEVLEQNIIKTDEFKSNIEEIHDQFVTTINNLREDFNKGDLRRRNIFKEYKVLMGDFRSNEDYPVFIYFVHRKFKDRNFKAKHLDDDLRKEQIQNLVEDLVKKGYGSLNLEDTTFIAPLVNKFDRELTSITNKRYKKSNLVMLGRGWVKAGFDFGQFTEDNFRYTPENQGIHFIGLKPKILSATINPWFIPEKGIEGFEFLIVERKVRRDYRVVQEVKQLCLDELKRKAHERKILNKATENASQTMKEFFSLLLDEPVKYVSFYENELEYTFEMIFENDSVSGEELILIDRLLRRKSILGIDTSQLEARKRVFIDSIQNRVQDTERTKMFPFERNEYAVHRWRPEYAMLYEIVKDGIFDEWNDAGYVVDYSEAHCGHKRAQTEVDWPHWKGSCEVMLKELVKDHVEIFILRNKTVIGQAKHSQLIAELNTMGMLNEVDSIMDGNSVDALAVNLDEEGENFDKLMTYSDIQGACDCN